jgi:hypothetical protein
MKYTNSELWQFIQLHPDFRNFSGTDSDLRDRTKENPALSIDLKKGQWYDHDTGEGGSLLELAKSLNDLPEENINPESMIISQADTGLSERQKASIQEQELWPEIIPLVRPDEEPQPYPINDLPVVIKEAILESRDYGKQPLALLGTSALAAVSLACQAFADVARDSELMGPCSLFFLTIAESGERKSNADKLFKKPLIEWETEQQKKMEPEITKSIAILEAWDEQKRALKDEIKKAKKDELRPSKTEDQHKS